MNLSNHIHQFTNVKELKIFCLIQINNVYYTFSKCEEAQKISCIEHFSLLGILFLELITLIKTKNINIKKG